MNFSKVSFALFIAKIILSLSAWFNVIGKLSLKLLRSKYIFNWIKLGIDGSRGSSSKFLLE